MMAIRKRALALFIGMAVVGAGGLLAQEPGEAPKGNPTVRRVPPYFGQVGLSPQQREMIYSIRGKYAGRAADLKRQLEQLQQQEMAECESVLNPTQRTQLAERRAASGRGRNSAKGDTAAKSSDANN
jgi:hypothetical protein